MRRAMLVAPETAEAAMRGTSFRLGLPLPGYEQCSVWGWDAQMGTLFAQVYSNGEDSRDEPRIWITSPRYPATGLPEVLAEWIATAAGCADSEVLAAMAESLGDSGARLRKMAAAA
jgi:hypothetical protein